MITRDHQELSISGQCALLGIHRSGLYYRPCAESEENLALMRRLDEQYFKTPFYGIRRLHALLVSEGYVINRKRMARLMGLVGWRTLYRSRRTTTRSKTHPVYPYLLKDLKIDRINQVWAMDITYIPMRRGFLYLTAIIDVASRYVVGWSVSNTMSAEWTTQVMREAIETHGRPEIVNTDQGSQLSLHRFSKTRESASAWTPKAEPSIISLLNGSGEQSNTSTSICNPQMTVSPSTRESTNTLTSTTENGYINHSDTKHRSHVTKKRHEFSQNHLNYSQKLS